MHKFEYNHNWGWLFSVFFFVLGFLSIIFGNFSDIILVRWLSIATAFLDFTICVYFAFKSV
jgi:MFS family permease